MRAWFDRAWPSLVALVGTVAVVLALLFVFGDNTGGGGDEAAAAPTDEPEDEATTDGESDAEADDGGADDETAEPEEEAEEPEANNEPEPTEAPQELRSPVGIANQTSVEGLELIARDRLEAGGWEVAATSPFNGDVPETTVYYPPGMEESAEALSRQFPEIGRVMPTFEGINQTRLVIVLVDDYIDSVDS